MNNTDNTALNKLLANQEAIAQGEATAHNLRALIAEKKGSIEAAESVLPKLDDMTKAREDLLAAVATGESKVSDIKKFDGECEAERAAYKSAQDSFLLSKNDVMQFISGLQRKLDGIDATIREHQDARQELVKALFRDYAERTGAEYLEAAQKAYRCYVRLLGLNTLSQQKGVPMNIVRFNHEFTLPSFALPGIEGGSKTVSTGALFDQWKVNYGTAIADSVAAIGTELRDAGLQC